MITILPAHLEDRFTARAKNALHFAYKMGGARAIHLLYALACEKGSLAKNVLETHRITSEVIAKALPQTNSAQISSGFKEIIKRAARIAAKQNQSYIGTEHLLYALIYNAKHMPDITAIINAKKIALIKLHLDTIFSQNVHLSSFPSILSTGGYARRIKRITSKKTHVHIRHGTQTPALDAFCENLTALAESYELDPVIGREKEISRIINILSRRTKNNPLLIGEPGVGKTAIVQGLAQRINNGEVPSSLLHKNIFSLNLNSLIAGTMFRGDFEARMQDILEEATRENVILFIDEIHTVIGAGSAQGTLDVANILKPSLSQGSIRCIGATTTDEYRKYIEKDRALERRLQAVIIEEETEEQSIETLSYLKKLYEKHHGITIEDETIEAAVQLSARYIRDRFLPDKALDVLDEAASRLKSKSAIVEHTKKIRELEKQKISLGKNKEKAIAEENYEDAIIFKHKEGLAEEEIRQFKNKFPLFQDKLVLKKSDIEATVEEMTGVPIQKSEGIQQFKKLNASLNKEIIGQKEAIRELISAIKRSRAGLSGTTKPVGSFLFLGPCGVGKTALAKAIAEHNSQTLIRLDMSEYAEPHTISRLIGSPPGYVGYGESGELTEKIRRHPYAVVLFDEIEKAHQAVHNLLLSILEDGTLTDSTGRKATFKNATIILTSNAGAENAEEARALGFSRSGKSRAESRKLQAIRNDKYSQEIKDALRPEIINRIAKIIVFKPLGKREILDISKLLIEKLKTQLAHLTITISDEAARHVAGRAYRPKEGARYVQTTIEQLIETPLAEYLIDQNGAKTANIDFKNGKIIVS
ncbi:MAG: ATP-dependent Clp protease ATP-binding subunit [Candidatus Spechtbacterales bacterium]